MGDLVEAEAVGEAPVGIRAWSEDVLRSILMVAEWAGGVVAGTWAEAIGVIGMEGMPKGKLKTSQLEVPWFSWERATGDISKMTCD